MSGTWKWRGDEAVVQWRNVTHGNYARDLHCVMCGVAAGLSIQEIAEGGAYKIEYVAQCVNYATIMWPCENPWDDMR